MIELSGLIAFWFLCVGIWRIACSNSPTDIQSRQELEAAGRALKADPAGFLSDMGQRVVIMFAVIALIFILAVGVLDKLIEKPNPLLTPEYIRTTNQRIEEYQKEKKELDEIRKLPTCTDEMPKMTPCRPDHPPLESDEVLGEIEQNGH